VILHIANEFVTTELKAELDNPAALVELRNIAITDPGSILADSSIVANNASWRVLPYPAANSGVIATTVTLSKHYSLLINNLRLAGEKENFPIITHALSAPLVAIMGLNKVLRPTPGKAFVVILQYPWLTVLGFFNEFADLRLVRTLQHRGLHRAKNFRNALATTDASLEFIDPDLYLIPLGSNVDTTLDTDLRITFPTSRVEVLQLTTLEAVPSYCPEPVIVANFANTDGLTITSHTFEILQDEKWALQDFLPSPKEAMEIYPIRSEIKLLRLLRLGRFVIFGITFLFLAYTSYGIIKLVTHKVWTFDKAQAKIIQTRLDKLTAENQKSDHWNNLLDDRSKAWSSMESLARMFPKDCGILVKSYAHTVKPESTPGQAKVGFIKQWKIIGCARNRALDYLNTLNTREGISSHFSEIAQVTGNTAYDPNIGNRNIVVNVRTQENSAYKIVPPEETNNADSTTYPYTFDLTITQRFGAADPLAIAVSTAPKKTGGNHR
jgi:hypothetical protein